MLKCGKYGKCGRRILAKLPVDDAEAEVVTVVCLHRKMVMVQSPHKYLPPLLECFSC